MHFSFLRDCAIVNPAPQALDESAAKRLWAISEAWTRAKSV